MNEIELKIHDLKNYALNINALSDISFLINKFNDLNNTKLDYWQKISLNDSLMFIIEQTTNVKNEENDLKLDIVKDIIKNYIFNNFEPTFYHYYLSIREALAFETTDVESILTQMFDDNLALLNEFQKASFINFLELLKEHLENKELIDKNIEKIRNIEINKDSYSEFAPSQIKVLTETSNDLQQELAAINYTLMIGGLL